MSRSRASLAVVGAGREARVVTANAAVPQRWTVRRAAADDWIEVVHQLVGDGFFPGDRAVTRIHAGPGSHLIVRGIAATSLRGCVGRSISATRITVAAGARLIFAPGALIPHAGANHWNSLQVHAEPGAAVLAFSVVVPGRSGMGERGAFAELRLRTRARVGPGGDTSPQGLALAEDATIRPSNTGIDGPAIFGGAAAALSALQLGDWGESSPLALLDAPGIVGRVGTLRQDGRVYRGLGTSLGVINDAVGRCIEAARTTGATLA